jgi:hypothetical protein
MPGWDVHNKWAVKLGIRKDISDMINRMIDSVGNPEYHDYGRVIVGGHWIFSEFFREIQHYYRLFLIDGVKGFLLHHILDYMSTLLHSPSVTLDKVLEYTLKLLNNIEDDSRSLVNDEELRGLIIRCCEEIKELIKDNNELLFDIKPKLSEWFGWAEERLVNLKCESCGRLFTTLDTEAIGFLARLSVGIPEQFVKYCIRCRTTAIKLLSDWISYMRRQVIEKEGEWPFGSPFHRIFYKHLGEVGDMIWGEVWGKTEALIHVLRAHELKELCSD